MDIEITWQSNSNNNSIFEENGTVVDGSEMPKNKELNLDVLFIFKNTTLRSIANHMVSKIAIDDSIVKWGVNFTLCCLLYALSPSNSSVHFFDDDDFKSVESLFKSKRGEYFVMKEALETISGGKDVIDVLIRNKVIIEDDDRYYVVGYMLKNLQIKKI